ncbi:hypothetical protein L486_02672 [Kwoniella mangroviensis CBS 10435]|uniref:WSC domain-containing protein n=1 Tax=Kwoniella mangroviensis CBS 10435 TaxID=1331196 RepID=A0A1B9IWU4_9TREE|nr:hypothetical protein L486_02672 [Kwoniella mangroviensis CBS 10435]
MFSKTIFILLPLLPLFRAAPLPAPLLGLDNLPILNGLTDPLFSQNDLPILPSIVPDTPTDLLSTNGGLVDTLLDTVESITGPLNVSLNANIDLLGINATLGLNVDLGDDEMLICGPVIGRWADQQYNVPCVCWSESRGIVIDAQLGIDLGLGEVDGLDAFLEAQIRFGGKQFTYPAYSMPTCDGDGGFNCPGGYQPNGKCTKFLAAKPRPRVLIQSVSSPTPTPTPSSDPTVDAVPTATDLIINSVPPTTLDGTPAATSIPTSAPSAVATIASPDQPQVQAQEDDGLVSVKNVALTTSTSTSTIVLPATVFVEMITTTQPMTIWATETQTQTQTQTQTVTSTSIQTQWATQTQTQWSTTTISNCASDEYIDVNSVPEQIQNAGFTPSPTSSSTFSPTPAPTITSSSSTIDEQAVPTPTTSTEETPAAPSATDVDDDAFVPPPRVIRLAKPQSHGELECSNGEEFKSTMCCRVDQVEVEGECKCADGLENVLNLNLCLSICLGERLPSGECSMLGLGTTLNLGLGDLTL